MSLRRGGRWGRCGVGVAGGALRVGKRSWAQRRAPERSLIESLRRWRRGASGAERGLSRARLHCGCRPADGLTTRPRWTAGTPTRAPWPPRSAAAGQQAAELRLWSPFLRVLSGAPALPPLPAVRGLGCPQSSRQHPFESLARFTPSPSQDDSWTPRGRAGRVDNWRAGGEPGTPGGGMLQQRHSLERGPSGWGGREGPGLVRQGTAGAKEQGRWAKDE